MGSLAYSILTAILGTLVEHYGVQTLPVSGEIVMLMLLFSLFLTRKQYLKVRAVNAEKGLIETKNREEDAEEITLTDFIRRNKVFFAINIGVVGVYFSNSVLNQLYDADCGRCRRRQ